MWDFKAKQTHVHLLCCANKASALSQGPLFLLHSCAPSNNIGPIAYQEYNNALFGQASITSFAVERVCIPWHYQFSYVHVTYAEQTSTFHNLLAIKNKSLSVVYPQKQWKCTMMLFTNLVHPEWISVRCDEKILGDVICSVQTPQIIISTGTNKSTDEVNFACSSFQLLKYKQCFLLLWDCGGSDFSRCCLNAEQIPFQITNISELYFVLKASSTMISPVLSVRQNRTDFITKFTYKRNTETYTISQNNDTKETYGFHFCTTDRKELQSSSALFQCPDGPYFSSLYLCDGTIDCIETQSDETNCTCELQFLGPTCMILSIPNKTQVCSTLYYTTHNYSCQKFSEMEHKSSRTVPTSEVFNCGHGQEIDALLLNDLVPDCGPNAEDEIMLVFALVNTTGAECANPNQLPCSPGHPLCCNSSNICTFRFDQFDHLLPCRNGGHLKSCTEFECNMMFNTRGAPALRRRL